MSDHPLIYLVQARTRQSHLRGAWLTGALLLGAAWLVPNHPLLLTALAAGIFPAVLTAQAVTALGQRGPDLEGTAVSSRQLVDGLALWLAWRSLPAVALLALYLQAPLALTLGLLVAYLGLLGWIWSDGEDDMLPRALIAGLCLTPGLVLLHHGYPGTADVVTLLILRAGCLIGWRSAERLGTAWRSCFRARSGRAMGLACEDALVYRELRRSVHRTALAWLLVPVAGWTGLLGLAAANPNERVVGFTLGVFLLLVQTLRAGWATVGCLADEREGRTLEALVGTRLSPREFVNAWGRWGSWPILVETLLVAGALSLFVEPGTLLATLIVVLASATGAAYAGVSASADAPRRLAAQDTLGLWLAGAFWIPGLMLLLASSLGLGILSLQALFLPWYWHRRALRSLNVQPDVTDRLSQLKTKAPASFKRDLFARLEAEGLA
jgi:hypothetical protein